MGIKFNADEVLQMACQIERNGAKFYREANEIIDDAKNSELLLKLASQEDEHLEIFENMRKELSGREVEVETYDPENEAVLYLKAMADGHVFDRKELSGNESMDDIFQTALQVEKDSIAFYVGLRDMVPEKAGQDKMEKIIREEMRHVRWILDQMKGAE